MKISSLKLKNFRSYRDEVEIKFENFTALIGKNDAGKSTILDALDIFFNDIELKEDDINLQAKKKAEKVVITVIFKDLPDTIKVDDSVETRLEEEYLLNDNKELEVIKEFSDKSKKGKVFIKATKYPTNPICQDLLSKKPEELRKIINDNQISNPNLRKNSNSDMRKAILNTFSANLGNAKIDASKIWDNLTKYLPIYIIFKADRENSDKDEEVQDPFKNAISELLEEDKEIQQQLEQVTEKIREKLLDVSNETVKKLEEIDKTVAESLKPRINAKNLKWQNVFKGISITDNNDIAINNRGSGVRRLVLLSFFRAKVERENKNIIYAIEEPETSQHAKNQEKLIKSLKALSEKNQILITTHSSIVVKNLKQEDLRIIVNQDNFKKIIPAEKGLLPYLSLNEINYLVFDDVSEAYHDELYSVLEEDDKKLLKQFRHKKSRKKYKVKNNETNKIEVWNIIQTECIRHQIHHPENTLNERFTQEDLRKSIELMRDFLNNTKDI